MKRLGYLTSKEQKVVKAFVKEIKEKLGDKIVFVKLFGSKVNGEFREDSDIDIFIVVRKRTPEIEEKVAEVEVEFDVKYGLWIAPVLYSLFEYQKNMELGSPLFENLEKEGIPL